MQKWSLQEVFRGLVIASTVCYLLVVFSPWLFWQGVSQETYAVLSWSGVGAFLPLPRGVYGLIVLLWVAVAVGMYQFSPQARLVFLVLTGFNLLLTLLGGMMTLMAFEAFLVTAATLMDGAILALAYLSPLKESFEDETGMAHPCAPPNDAAAAPPASSNVTDRPSSVS
jgi:hypothetical protein